MFFFDKNNAFLPFYESMPNQSGVYIVTGPNGVGKSRFLSDISNSYLHAEYGGFEGYSRLICLSGSISDRYPQDNLRRYGNKSIEYSSELKGYSNNDEILNYAYFGRKRNKTLFTEMAPFQRILFYINRINVENNANFELVADLFNFIGLGSEIEFKISFKGSARELGREFGSVKTSLRNVRFYDASHIDWLELYRKDQASLDDFFVYKDDRKVSFRDLSSGERSFIVSMLSLAFSVQGKCLVLYDEPENSLHPEWQLEIVSRMWKLISTFSSDSKLIIATHSPLIISGSRNSYTHVLDLKPDGKWKPSEMYGNTPGVILKEQFGVASPRSKAFIKAFQRCLDAYATREFQVEEFRQRANELFDLGVRFEEDDALYLPYLSLREALEELDQ